jgi:hypothetical protein
MNAANERARSVRVIREQMAWWGHPLDHLTDDEIEEGVVRGAEALRSVGITVVDAAAQFAALAGAIRAANASPDASAVESEGQNDAP